MSLGSQTGRPQREEDAIPHEGSAIAPQTCTSPHNMSSVVTGLTEGSGCGGEKAAKCPNLRPGGST